ncbi:HTH_48 domain-containing protein [Trichonephila clavipes]|nr:HTH_48 domain-containing protein [Trichonephila clavipes]
MDDNTTCHRTLAVHDCLDSECIQRLVWPVRSPDLNPIENVWDALGRQVAGRNQPPTNKNTLIRALTEEWDKLPQQLLDNVVQKGRESIEDKPRSERPSVSKTAENVVRVRDLVLSDRRLTVGMIGEELNLNHIIVHQILTNELKMRKICAKMVPKNLSH